MTWLHLDPAVLKTLDHLNELVDKRNKQRQAAWRRLRMNRTLSDLVSVRTDTPGIMRLTQHCSMSNYTVELNNAEMEQLLPELIAKVRKYQKATSTLTPEMKKDAVPLLCLKCGTPLSILQQISHRDGLKYTVWCLSHIEKFAECGTFTGDSLENVFQEFYKSYFAEASKA